MPPVPAVVPALRGAAERHADVSTSSAVHSLLRLRGAIAGLRRASAEAELVRLVPEAVASLGFDLALYAHVRGDVWTPAAGHGPHAPRVLGLRSSASSPESPRPCLVALPDARLVGRSCPERAVLEELESSALDNLCGTSLVPDWPCGTVLAAPVVERGAVVGLIHAGRTGAWAATKEADEEVLGLFAEAFGALLSAARAVESVRDIAARMAGLADELAPLPSSRPAKPGHDLAAEISPRECAVLELVAAGLTNGQIARRLVITEGTAKSHVKRILRKLGAANRAEAACAWTRMNTKEHSDR